MMKRMKKMMRVDSEQEEMMQEAKKWKLYNNNMLRIVEKYGDRCRSQLMTKMMKADKNGQKGIHRINIFEDLIFNNIYIFNTYLSCNII